nr:unnamed protein product [Haemonchus contortus]
MVYGHRGDLVTLDASFDLFVAYFSAFIVTIYSLILCSEREEAGSHRVLRKDTEEELRPESLRSDTEHSLHSSSIHSPAPSAPSSTMDAEKNEPKQPPRNHLTEREIAMMIFNPNL